jgi:hypothetical protein
MKYRISNPQNKGCKVQRPEHSLIDHSKGRESANTSPFLYDVMTHVVGHFAFYLLLVVVLIVVKAISEFDVFFSQILAVLK